MVVSQSDIDVVSIVGGGKMGRGIAAVTALAGYETHIYDIDKSQLEQAQEKIEWSYRKINDKGKATKQEIDDSLNRISYTDDIYTANSEADFAIEAVVENQIVKENVFEDLNESTPNSAILASNTSGLNITKLAESTTRPNQVVGTHWFNPPMLMDLVEVIGTEYTTNEVINTSLEFIESLNKEPILCKKDIPRFIVNRLMRPFTEEPAWMVYRGEYEIEEIDSAMKYREGFPMGPFELRDFTGGIKGLVESEDEHLNDDRLLSYDVGICPILHQLYEKGRYGRSTDGGFYDYTDQEEPAIPVDAGQGFDTMLIWGPIMNEAAKLIQHDIASVEDVDKGAKLGGNWPHGPFEKFDEIGARTVLRKLTYAASRHENVHKLSENLPCSLLIEKAKSEDTFY